MPPEHVSQHLAFATGHSSASQQITVSLPLPRSLLPNKRPNQWDRWRDVRTWRMLARSETAARLTSVTGRDWPAATLDIEWYAARGPLPDDDGVVSAAKAARDGMADAVMAGGDAGIRLGTVTTYRGPDVLVLRLTREEEAG